MSTLKNMAVGDRYRCVATVTFLGSHGGPHLEIDMSTMELLERAKSPGQQAYEARFEGISNPGWGMISAPDRAMWERIAEAARRA